jgi:hypothetical protein
VLPRIVRADGACGDGEDGGPSLEDLVGRVTAEEAAILSGESGAGQNGSVAVIVPPSLLPGLADALTRAGIGFGTVGAGVLDDTVALVTVDVVKGLEFDAVVVVEPAAIVDEAPQGLRSLYVALTRATRRLSIVHRGPLPEPLAG